MLILASASDILRQRWREALREPCVEVHHADALGQALRQDASALVLIHLGLPGLQGLEGVGALRQDWPGALLMALSDLPGEPEGRALMRLGVHGYANAHINAGLLTKAVRVIRQGEVWVGRRLMQHLIEELTHHAPSHPALRDLTAREREVAGLVADGHCNKRIAVRLGVSERTVKSHITAILRKTHAGDRLALAMLVKGHAPAGLRG